MQNGMIEATGGQFLQFINVLWKVVKKMDATTLEGWLKNLDGLFKVLSEALLPPFANVFKLLVNYNRSVEEGVKAGKYDWTNSDITSKNFPTKESGETEMEIQLVHFSKVMSTDEILRRLDKQGLRPATLPELLAIGEKYPELQREFPIMAVGSVWRDPHGDRGVPCLGGGGDERGLSLNWYESDWRGIYRFASVRK